MPGYFAGEFPYELQDGYASVQEALDALPHCFNTPLKTVCLMRHGNPIWIGLTSIGAPSNHKEVMAMTLRRSQLCKPI